MTDHAYAPQPDEPETSVFGSRPWSRRAALWLVALAFSMSLLGSLAIQSALSRPYSDTATALIAAVALTLGYVVELAVVRAVAVSRGTSFGSMVGLVRPRDFTGRTWIAVAVGGAVLARLFAAGYGLLVDRLGVTVPGADSNPLSAFPGGTVSALVMLAVVVFLAPFAEEVIFRGVLLPAFGTRGETAAGLMVSSVLFSALHVSVFLFLPIMVAALVFGGVAIRFRSLWPAYLAHATFNAVAAVALIVFRWQGVV